ncbi:hypothetical protein Slala03_50560 [Streptomyces lavendulae subsp. lavendulae]|nr:hypothetical protein Slala03_50560 [Streptomyces lavendulae subsp. lavendulae]
MLEAARREASNIPVTSHVDSNRTRHDTPQTTASAPARPPSCAANPRHRCGLRRCGHFPPRRGRTAAAPCARSRAGRHRPRVEYALTEPGQALRVTIDGLCDWTHRYLGHIEASRNRFDGA